MASVPGYSYLPHRLTWYPANGHALLTFRADCSVASELVHPAGSSLGLSRNDCATWFMDCRPMRCIFFFLGGVYGWAWQSPQAPINGSTSSPFTALRGFKVLTATGLKRRPCTLAVIASRRMRMSECSPSDAENRVKTAEKRGF